MVHVPAATYRVGAEGPACNPDDGEGPIRDVQQAAFLIEPTCVSNAEFACFVQATGYRTDAESHGWSYVFAGFLPPTVPDRDILGPVPEAPWWVGVRGACWHAPEGALSSLDGRDDHPVTHVSWRDARRYAGWAGRRLPTETEWEIAARGALAGATYPWGDELRPGGTHRCNIWQGRFPTYNSGADGFLGTAPVDAFEPNGLGLYNMVGNVWEWCLDRWSTTWHIAPSPQTRRSPTGPTAGTVRTIRGGSYLCHLSYCTRYRVSARTFNSPDSSTGHMGFRCAADVPDRTGTDDQG